MKPELDPHNINVRLAKQVSEMLRQLEEDRDVTLKERYMALMAIGRLQVIFTTLRKEKVDEPERGSAVRQYEGAFKAHDARRRKTNARAAAKSPEPATLDHLLADGEDGDGFTS